MRTCAFLTTDDLAGHVTDDSLAEEPLAELGWAVEHVSWRQGGWERYEAVVIRSTWDYHKHPEEFLGALEAIDGSGARLKSPREADFRVQEEHGGLIRKVDPPEILVDLGHRIVESLPVPPLYARVDLARLDSGTYALMELELIEPSLYFRTDPESPRRFARAFDEWMKELVG